MFTMFNSNTTNIIVITELEFFKYMIDLFGA